MRVIAGELRGRKLKAPHGNETRPTADRVKEAMFSMLESVKLTEDPERRPFENERVLDLYAGSGALGIEALSRGAAQVVFVEQSRPALIELGENLRALGLLAQATVLAASVARSIERIRSLGPFALTLVDPPYEDVASGAVSKLLTRLVESGGLSKGGALVLEHATRDAPPTIAGTEFDRSRKYGDTTVSLYRLV